jgi:CheY-like chemotaxis protein
MSGPGRRAERGSGSMRVLVADDDAGQRSALVALLGSYGCEVWEARDGLEAVQQASEHRPALILMDLRMPGFDGYQATRLLREDPAAREIRILALTTEPGAERHLRALGFCGALKKPCTSAALLRAVVRCMDGEDDG